MQVDIFTAFSAQTGPCVTGKLGNRLLRRRTAFAADSIELTDKKKPGSAGGGDSSGGGKIV